MESLLAPLVIVLFLGLFAAIIFLMVRQSRRQQNEKLSRAKALGFSPVPLPDAGLLERLAGLFGRSPERLALKNVFERERSGVRLVLFDLEDRSDTDSSMVAEDGLLLLTPSLDLPHFTLLPRPDLGGAWGGLADKIIQKAVDWGAGRGGQQLVSFPENPGFEKRFMVAARDEQAVRDFFTTDRGARLGQAVKGLAFSGGPGGLVVKRETYGQTQKIDLEQLRTQINQAMTVYEILR